MFKFTNDVLKILDSTWPIILVTCISVISIRITSLIKYKKKFVFYEELLNLIFIIYLLMFFQFVTYQDVISYGNNFIPFKELTRYRIGSNLFFKNIIGNILLFTPYGFFVSYYLRLNKKRIVLILVLIMSLSIEFTQLLIGRSFDIDDILLNIIGGMLGYLIYYILDIITDKMSKRTITLILIDVIILGIVFLLFMMM